MATKTTKKTGAKTSTKNTTTKKAKRTNGFAAGDYVVYPTHGVGQITGIEEQEIVGMKLKLCLVISPFPFSLFFFFLVGGGG